MESFVAVLMLLLAHFGACVALLGVARNKIAGRFYLLSLIGIWAGYAGYEAFLIDCSLAKCNIRPDLLVIFPYLIATSIVTILGMRRHLFDAGAAAALASRGPASAAAVDSRASDGTSELMSRAAIGDLGGMKALLAAGADLEAADERGWTSLMYAASRDELEAVELLLGKGADPARKNSEHLTAGDIARREGHHEVARVLDGAKGRA